MPTPDKILSGVNFLQRLGEKVEDFPAFKVNSQLNPLTYPIETAIIRREEGVVAACFAGPVNILGETPGRA